MLAKRPLTQRTVESLKPTGQRYMVYDALCPGFAVRVMPGGYKSYVLVRRYPGSPNPTARAIAQVGAVSLEWARARAREWQQAIAEGRDPAIDRAETFRAIAEEYLAREGSKLRTGAIRKATLERLVYPSLGTRPVGEIKRQEIVRLLDKIEDENGSAMSDVTLALISKIFNWHSSRTEFKSPIVRGMRRHDNASRQRVLTDDELRQIWRAGDGVFGELVKFLLLAACRRGEAAGLRRSEIVGGDWIIPRARFKTGLELVVPLSGAARAIIEGLPNLGDVVFTIDGRSPIRSFSKSKANLDKATGVKDWVLHDLRRTSRSFLSRAGVNSDVAERCLGHVIGGVRGVYDRHSYHEEKRIAFGKLAVLIESIVSPSENVVPMVRQTS